MIKKMYDGIANSPETYLTQGIDANVTDIVVDDAEMLLQGENLAVIGLGIDAETIKYSSINGNILVGCTRGFEGVAKSWESGTPIARNFTAYDHNTFKENVENLDNEKADKTELNTKVDKVSGKQLSTNDYTDEAKNKVDAIPPNPKYTDTIYNDEDLSGRVSVLENKEDKDTTYTAGTNVTITGTTISAKDTIYDDTALETRITAVENREDKDTTYDVATTTTDGLMSSADKVKLDGVEAGAEKNIITSVQGRTGTITISKSDVGLGSVNNVAITQAQVTKINELNYTRAMTQAQYEALSQAEKERTDVWYGIYKE